MNARALSSILSASALLALSACGPGPSTCVPGAQVACACAGGGSGIQRCNAEGALDECMGCPGPIPDASIPDASEPDASIVDASVDAGSDGSTADAGAPLPCTDELDLVFMVDNSNSMYEEQAALTLELPRLVRALTSGDRDLDGIQDFTPISSLHVGVISSDMGSGGHSVATCGGGTFGAMFGDDGVLLGRGRTAMPGCSATYPPIFEYVSGDDTTEFATDVACVVTTGTGGCGLEQQLEAVLKSVSPSAPTAWTAEGYAPPSFFSTTTGHALGANAGFVREGSILAALVVTDEEDCSASDTNLFDPASTTYTSDLGLRCFTYPAALHPVGRFVTGLAALRRDPRRLVLSVVAGVPPDLAGDTDAEYAAILADVRMQERVDETVPGRLVPSCDVPGRGLAFPPRRIVSVARGLEALGVQTDVQSICRDDFSPATDALVTSIANAAAVCR